MAGVKIKSGYERAEQAAEQMQCLGFRLNRKILLDGTEPVLHSSGFYLTNDGGVYYLDHTVRL